MPRYVADIMIFGQCEVEADSQSEAREHFVRAFGTDLSRPEIDVSVPASNGGPVRLINTDPSIGMVGMRTEVLG